MHGQRKDPVTGIRKDALTSDDIITISEELNSAIAQAVYDGIQAIEPCEDSGISFKRKIQFITEWDHHRHVIKVLDLEVRNWMSANQLGQGLYFWFNRHSQPWRKDIENHVRTVLVISPLYRQLVTTLGFAAFDDTTAEDAT